MKYTSLALLFCTTASPLVAEISFNEDYLTGSVGVFCSQPSVDSVEAPGTAIGRIDLFSGMPDFIWDTSVLPAAQGISFGIKTRTHSEEFLIGVIITTTHPPFLNDGTTSQTYVTTLGGADDHINAYTFDFPYEQVTGQWSFKAELDGVILYEVDFEVVSPDLLPHITNGCGEAFMS